MNEPRYEVYYVVEGPDGSESEVFDKWIDAIEYAEDQARRKLEAEGAFEGRFVVSTCNRALPASHEGGDG